MAAVAGPAGDSNLSARSRSITVGTLVAADARDEIAIAKKQVTYFRGLDGLPS